MINQKLNSQNQTANRKTDKVGRIDLRVMWLGVGVEEMNRDEIVEFLEKLGIKTELLNNGDEYFKRDIQFYINGIRYVIRWFVNESTLKIGEGDRGACIPFKYMYYDTTYPLTNGNKSIGFSYTKNEKSNVFDRMYPYEALRIPL